MAVALGKDGFVRIGSTVITKIDAFSLETATETVDITSYGDDTDVTKVTSKNWSGSFSGNFDRSDAQQAALLSQFEDGSLSDVNLQLGHAASSYWYGSATITGWSVSSARKDKVTVSFNYQSAGTLYHKDGS